jgi:NDP-sugar pyrophosphorylase family protein
MVRTAAHTQALGFAGIHIISPRIFSLMSPAPMGADGGRKEKAFSIIPEYLRLAGEGEKILGFQADGSYWRDLGTIANLKQAAEDMKQKVFE